MDVHKKEIVAIISDVGLKSETCTFGATTNLMLLKDWLLEHQRTHVLSGYKIDKKDRAWICKLLLSGFLEGRFNRWTFPNARESFICLK